MGVAMLVHGCYFFLLFIFNGPLETEFSREYVKCVEIFGVL